MGKKRVLLAIVAIASIFIANALPVRASDYASWYSFVSENQENTEVFEPKWEVSDFTVQDAKNYWKNQLSEQEMILYENIEKAAHAGNTGEFSFTINCPGIWHGGETAVHATIQNMVANSSSAFSFDQPMYWCKYYEYEAFANGEDVTITMKLTPYYEGYFEELGKVKECLENLEKEIANQSNTEDSFLLLEGIYTSLVQNLVYSFDSDRETVDANLDNGIVHTFSGALLEKYNHYAVCSAYSGLFMTICNDFGIPCIQVSATETEGLPHSFNYVCLGNQWYLVDATWGDQGEIPEWRYFLAGSKFAIKGHHPDGQLSCREASDKFKAPSLAEKTFYQVENNAIHVTAQKEYRVDMCDWRRNQETTLQITMDYPSWPILSGLEYCFKEDGSYQPVVNGQITLELNQEKDLNLYLYNRYVTEIPVSNMKIKVYPKAVYSENEDEVEVICLNNYFTVQPLLDFEADQYEIHSQDGDVSLCFTKEQLYSLKDEIALNDGEAHFKEFSLDFVGFYDGIYERSSFYSFEEGGGIYSELYKLANSVDKKFGTSKLLLGLELPFYEEAYETAGVKFDMHFLMEDPEDIQGEMDYLPRTMYVYNVTDQGDYELLGNAVYSKDGILTIPNPGKRMVFYEKELLTKTQYYSRILGVLTASIVLIIIIFKLLQKRTCNGLDNMVN